MTIIVYPRYICDIYVYRRTLPDYTVYNIAILYQQINGINSRLELSKPILFILNLCCFHQKKKNK